MLNWHHVEYETEQRSKAYVAWAEKRRQMHRAVKNNSGLTKSYQRWLVRLGTWLIAWGCRLQARYGEPPVIACALPQERQTIGHQIIL